MTLRILGLATLVVAAVASAATAPTFSRDVLPILQSRCQSCHRQGEIGPMSLLSYAEVRPWAATIRQAVLSGQMPPWHSDTPNQKFHNDPSLTVEQKKTIADWASNGAPEGNPKDARPNPVFTTGWNIGEPDLVVKPAKPFGVPATGTVEYTYYIVPKAFEQDTWVIASEFRSTNRSVMHHGVAFVRPPSSKWLRNYPAGKYFVPVEQTEIPGAAHPSATTNAGATAVDINIAGYVPGRVAAPKPEGHGTLVPAGSDLVFQLHYTPKGQTASDLPSVGFRFSKAKPEKQILSLLAVDDTFAIPPGAANYPVHGVSKLGVDADLYSVYPHMHLRGKSMLLKATYPDGRTEILLNVPRYDFNWQLEYDFDEPKHLPAGTVLESFATFDNSPNNKWNPAPEKEVRWGDQSGSEMMIGYFRLSVAAGLDKKLLSAPRSAPMLSTAEAKR